MIFAVILLVFGLLDCEAFNIDINVPIVKLGLAESYFGYSVSPHYIRTGTGVRPVILVGAPKDNITDPNALLVVRQFVRPGVVYQCPLTTLTGDCTDVKIDREPPEREDDKSEQWMGVSVVSQATDDGKALACAHRFRQSSMRRSYRWGLGYCITLTNALDEEMPLQPCGGRDMNTPEGMFAYGFCQTGASAAVSKDGDVLLGVPGPYNWRGALFKNIFSTGSLFDDQQWYHSPVVSPATDPLPEPPVAYYSYLGMSVKIANISGEKWYIGGAPRSKYFGQVLMFRQVNAYLRIERRHILVGGQFGEGFGHDLAVSDFNGDGKEDLVVCAPFYHEPGISGAIYVYYNSEVGITSITEPQVIHSRSMKDAECKALNCLDARFGSAVSAVGDIDLDGYQDLAVGAPYEGAGAVYMYYGSANGLPPVHSQRIYARDLASNMAFSGFGASLAGGADLDDSGYPDIVIGAYQSNAVAVLLARPVVNIEASISAVPERIDTSTESCSVDDSPNVCFEVRVCFRFTAEPRNKFARKLGVSYVLDAAKLSSAKLVRAVFPRRDSSGRTSEELTISSSLMMHEQLQARDVCSTHLVYITKSNWDFMRPIQIQLTYDLSNVGEPSLSPGSRLPDINDYPVVNKAQTEKNFSVNFAHKCGDDHVCSSSLSLTSSLSIPRDSETGVYKLTVGQEQELVLTAVVYNDGEEAHQTMLSVVLPPNLDYVGTTTKDTPLCSPSDRLVQCVLGNPLKQEASVMTEIRLDATHLAATHVPLYIAVNVTTTSAESNMDNNVANISFIVIIKTDLALRGGSHPQQVAYGGEVLGESVIEAEEQIGNKVVHNYEVRNEGEVIVPNATLTVMWPYALKDVPDGDPGKHVLYLMQEPVLYDGDRRKGYCVYEESWVNPLHIETVDEHPGGTGEDATPIAVHKEDEAKLLRRRRATERSRSPRAARHSRVVSLDCRDADVACRSMQCVLGEIRPRGGIALRLIFRLWNHTFTEEYASVYRILIKSRAKVEIDPSLGIVQTIKTNDAIELVTTAIPDDTLVQRREGIPIWVIILAVIAGVILLSLLIVCLWKCGFFKRHRRGDEAPYRASMQKHDPLMYDYRD